MNTSELNVNFSPRSVSETMANMMKTNAFHEHPCCFNGSTGRMSISEAEIIANAISESVEPLMKWVSVKHAIHRGDSPEELALQFPWLDLYESDEDSSDDSEDDTGDDSDGDTLEHISEGDEGTYEADDDRFKPIDADIPDCTPHPDIPQEISDTIYATWGLTPEQVDTIMQLVSLPENGGTQWPLFYNYIEWGKDSDIRGFTGTIFGATTGTGSMLEIWKELKQLDPDHPLVVKYMDAMESAKGGNISGLEGLAHVNGDPTKAVAKYSNWTPNGRTHLDHIMGDFATMDVDETWRRAVWRAFLRLNWESAAHFCNKTGPCAERPGPVLTTPLSKGFIVDTSLNHGDCRWWATSDTWGAIWNEMDSHPSSETSWLKKFMKARRRVLRSGFQGLDWSKSGDRVSLWKSLLNDGNTDLDRPIEIPPSTHTPPIWPPNLVIE